MVQPVEELQLATAAAVAAVVILVPEERLQVVTKQVVIAVVEQFASFVAKASSLLFLEAIVTAALLLASQV